MREADAPHPRIDSALTDEEVLLLGQGSRCPKLRKANGILKGHTSIARVRISRHEPQVVRLPNRIGRSRIDGLWAKGAVWVARLWRVGKCGHGPCCGEVSRRNRKICPGICSNDLAVEDLISRASCDQMYRRFARKVRGGPPGKCADDRRQSGCCNRSARENGGPIDCIDGRANERTGRTRP